MTHLTAMIRFRCDLEITQVAEKLSQVLFGNIPFARADLDELVSYRLTSSVLGMVIRVSGVRPNYVLDVDTSYAALRMSLPVEYILTDCSDYLSGILCNVDGITIEPL